MKATLSELELPKAVIFDTDNTLYPYEPAHNAAIVAVTNKAKHTLGVSDTEFLDAYKQARDTIKKLLGETASSHSRLLYFQRAIEMLGLKTQILMTLDLEQTYWRTFLSNCRLFPKVKEFLLELKSHGIITAIITDLTAQIQFRKLIYFGLDDYYDYVVTSEEAGVDKPSIIPFEIALDKLKTDPTKIWMIGDSPTNDMIGAAQLKMVKVQKVHTGVKVEKEGPAKPDVCFGDYAELIEIIKKINQN